MHPKYDNGSMPGGKLNLRLRKQAPKRKQPTTKGRTYTLPGTPKLFGTAGEPKAPKPKRR